MTEPFRLGIVLGTGFAIWLKHLPRFVLLTVICHLLLVAWWLARSQHWLDGWDAFVFGRHPVVRLLLDATFVVQALVAAAVTHRVLGVLRGQRATIAGGLGTVVRRALPVIGVAIVVRALTMGVLVGIGLVLWEVALGMRFREVAWYGGFALYLVLLSPLWIALPIAASERCGVLGSLLRGVRLARGHRIAVFAIVVVEAVVNVGLHMLARTIVLPDLATASLADYGAAFQLYTFVALGLGIVLASLGATLAATTYHCLQRSKEGARPEELEQVFA